MSPPRRTTHKSSDGLVAGPALAGTTVPLRQGRQAYQRRQWETAFTRLSDADRLESLGHEDLERLAVAAYLSGHDHDSEVNWTRAYHDAVARGDIDRAARHAFWQGMTLFDRGQSAPGGGWIARARRLLDDHQRNCVERGYLLLPDAIAKVMAGDFEAASALFEEAAAVGDRFSDHDLQALARQGRGRALTRLGRIPQGVLLLDEAMVAVMAGEISPIAAGVVYCSVIDACHEIFDLKRAREWTEALGSWCDAQPDLVPFRGVCLVRRSEILQGRGVWSEALVEAIRACERLAHWPNQSGIALAFYQLGEVHRLRGEFTEAETAFRAASQHGRPPEPGRALLRLNEGQGEAAVGAIRRACDETQDRKWRSRILDAAVEIYLAAGQVADAREASAELAAIADQFDAPLIRASAKRAAGAVLLADSDPRAALAALRESMSLWRELDVPYETARVGILIGLACRALGDHDAAALELDAARRVFDRLGAGPDVLRVTTLAGPTAGESAGPLTAREAEVLRLVATGRTNRAIAQQLRISEKTVARHLSNIFTKLGISTRSAATAYAYRHNQVR